jgi:tight adherence protein B
MVDGMTIMANGVKSGLSITQSMERVVANMNGPLPQEFTLVLNQIRLGRSVEEALIEFGERIPRADVQMFVTAVNILKETGGNLAETFTTIVTTVRERQKVEKKIEAMTSQGTMQAIIVTLVPFALLVLFLVVDPTFVMPLFTKPLGWFALFMMIGLQVMGGVMMKKVVTIKV